jgi:hypothetical protein
VKSAVNSEFYLPEWKRRIATTNTSGNALPIRQTFSGSIVVFHIMSPASDTATNGLTETNTARRYVPLPQASAHGGIASIKSPTSKAEVEPADAAEPSTGVRSAFALSLITISWKGPLIFVVHYR